MIVQIKAIRDRFADLEAQLVSCNNPLQLDCLNEEYQRLAEQWEALWQKWDEEVGFCLERSGETNAARL